MRLIVIATLLSGCASFAGEPPGAAELRAAIAPGCSGELCVGALPVEWVPEAEITAGILNGGERTLRGRLVMGEFIDGNISSSSFVEDLELDPGEIHVHSFSVFADREGGQQLYSATVVDLLFMLDGARAATALPLLRGGEPIPRPPPFPVEALEIPVEGMAPPEDVYQGTSPTGAWRLEVEASEWGQGIVSARLVSEEATRPIAAPLSRGLFVDGELAALYCDGMSILPDRRSISVDAIVPSSAGDARYADLVVSFGGQIVAQPVPILRAGAPVARPADAREPAPELPASTAPPPGVEGEPGIEVDVRVASWARDSPVHLAVTSTSDDAIQLRTASAWAGGCDVVDARFPPLARVPPGETRTLDGVLLPFEAWRAGDLTVRVTTDGGSVTVHVRGPDA